MRRAKAQIDIINLKKRFDKLFQHPFEVGHRDVFINCKPFDLMKHRRVGLIIIRAVNAARANHPHRGAGFFHGADLNRAGMRAKHMRRTVVPVGPVHIKRVHFSAGRMMPGDVQGVKIIPIGINSRPFGHGKTHIGKDCSDFFHDLRYWMNAALTSAPRRQSDIQPFSAQPRVKRRIRKR